MKSVGVVIPFFKAQEKLDQCLAAMRAQTYQPIDIYVRDNSHDNILFTAAINEGLQRYCYCPDYDYVLILNQDGYMEPDALTILVGYMEAHPECGIACPLQVINGHVSWGGSWQAFPFGVHRCDALTSYKEPFDTYWANGAGMLIRTALVREIGLWDKGMRFICSDADFSFTARARGWGVTVVPDARMTHGLDASGRSTSHWLNKIKLEDASYFARKWLTGGLYRFLSYEGYGLTNAVVDRVVAEWNATLNQYPEDDVLSD